MSRKSRKNVKLIRYILENVESHPGDIAKVAAETFGVSRTTINNYLSQLVEEGKLNAHGKTNARVYDLKPVAHDTFMIELSSGLAEDAIWRHRVLPNLVDVPRNILDICQYCFTEMLNNAIDHSASDIALIQYRQSYQHLEMQIFDEGVGIFNKIQKDFDLPDQRTALLELSKGKLTSDKVNHSGQGIFFTSRMLDKFSILSGELYYSRGREGEDDEWLIEVSEKEGVEKGTFVKMRISLHTDRTMRGVFDYYQGDDLSFRKAHVPIKLSKYPGELLVSRSQAKRVLARFEDFTEVMLDFKNVDDIGQGFADEIFRVFRSNHPEIEIVWVNTNEKIDKMIAFVEAYDASD